MNGFLSVEDIIPCNTYCLAFFLSARLMYSCSFLKPSEILQAVLTSQLIEIILPLLFIYLFIYVFFWPFLPFFPPRFHLFGDFLKLLSPKGSTFAS